MNNLRDSSSWLTSLLVGISFAACVDPPGDPILEIDLVGDNSNATDISSLGFAPTRIELLISETQAGEPQKILVPDSGGREISLSFDQGPIARETLAMYVPKAGFLHQIRLILDGATVAGPAAPSGTALAKVPSGPQTGIKISPRDGVPFELRRNSSTRIEVRIDVGDQINRPKKTEFHFKPTLQAILMEPRAPFEPKPLIEPGEVYVIFKDQTSEEAIAAAHAAANATQLRRYARRPWITVRVPAGTEATVAAGYRARPEVAWAAPNFNLGTLDGEQLPSEWGGEATVQPWSTTTRAPEAWELTQGSRDVIVAVLDFGFGFNDEIEENVFLNPGEFPTAITLTPTCQPRVTPIPLPTVTDVAGASDGSADGVISIADFNSPTSRLIWLPLVGKDPLDTNARVRILDLIKMPQNQCGIFEDGEDTDSNTFTDDIAGWSFATNSNNFDANTAAEASHGTTNAALVGAPEATASVFAGVPNLLPARRAGVAWRVRLLLIGVIGGSPLGENTHRAFDYAALMGARVANMSASIVCLDKSMGPVPGLTDERKALITCDAALKATLLQTFEQFVATARGGSILFTTGASNERFDVDSNLVTIWPAESDIPNLIAVANMTNDLKLPAAKAPWGVKTFDIAAPGEAIPMLTEEGFPYNTAFNPDGFAHNAAGDVILFRGTSHAAPQVAGAAALLLSINPTRFNENPADTKAVILNSAKRSNFLNTKVSEGRYLDLRAAVEMGAP